MTLKEWWDKTSPKKIDLLAQALLNKTSYIPDWKYPKRQWEIIASRRVDKIVVLLCKRETEYAVFTDYLMPKMYPSDKFYGSLRDGVSSYNEEVLRRMGVI